MEPPGTDLGGVGGVQAPACDTVAVVVPGCEDRVAGEVESVEGGQEHLPYLLHGPDQEWEEEYLTAWNLGIAKFGLSDEVLGALERCTKGLHEHMTIENS